jgi:hypothetical protein
MVKGLSQYATITFLVEPQHVPFCPTWASAHPITEDLPPHDAILFYSKVTTFLGGTITDQTIHAAQAMAKTDRPIFQLGFDNSIGFLDLKSELLKREGSGNKKYEQSFIDSLEITAPKRLIAQQRNHELTAQYMVNEYRLEAYHLETTSHFPLEGWSWDTSKFLTPLKSPRFDLQYIGATFNGGERCLPFLRYYTGLPKDISVNIRGTLRMQEAIDLAKSLHKKRGGRGDIPTIPQCGEPVMATSMLGTNNESLAQVVIAVRHNRLLGNVPLRISELAMSGSVALFDQFTTHSAAQDPYLMVDNQLQVIEKIRELKSDYAKRVTLVTSERDRLNETYKDFGLNFYKHLTGLL